MRFFARSSVVVFVCLRCFPDVSCLNSMNQAKFGGVECAVPELGGRLFGARTNKLAS
jgi:hypothetical protein